MHVSKPFTTHILSKFLTLAAICLVVGQAALSAPSQTVGRSQPRFQPTLAGKTRLSKGDVEMCLRTAFVKPKALLENSVYERIELDLTRLEDEPTPNDSELSALAHKWGCHFLEVGKVQEAIWLFDRTRQYELSEYIVQRIKVITSKGQITVECATSRNFQDIRLRGRVMADAQGEPRFAGVCSSFVARVGSVRFLLKYQDPSFKNSQRNEIFAYEVDRALGLNRVPLTVGTKLKDREASLQLFVHGGHHDPIYQLSVRRYENVPEVEGIFVLDYLLAARDRHSQNVLVGPDKRLIAIDNGRLDLTQPTVPSFVDIILAKKTHLLSRTIGNLSHISRLDLRSQLASHLPAEEWDVFLTRFNRLQKLMLEHTNNTEKPNEWRRSALPSVRAAEARLRINLEMHPANSDVASSSRRASYKSAEVLRSQNYAAKIASRSREMLPSLRAQLNGSSAPKIQVYGRFISENGKIFNEYSDAHWEHWVGNPPSYLVLLIQMYAERKLSLWDVKALIEPAFTVDKRSFDEKVLSALLKTPAIPEMVSAEKWEVILQQVMNALLSSRQSSSVELKSFWARMVRAGNGSTPQSCAKAF